ncbi:MAG: hypothetical protein II008_10315 [Oscillospiraceae bacterium]|nr:hypothetical protein [Oscillospiraceae bacterium]
MNNPYKTYIVSELVQIIEHAALDLLNEPIFGGKKADGTLMNAVEVAQQNSMTAIYNSGIRLMARVLIEELTDEGKEDDSGG